MGSSDELTTATLLVGLIGRYRSEFRLNFKSESDKFFTWLIDHGHDDIATIIATNEKISAAVAAVLAANPDKIRSAFLEFDLSIGAARYEHPALIQLVTAILGDMYPPPELSAR
jgi:hypothetical protein